MMMLSLPVRISLPLVALALAACQGGGGGGNPVLVTEKACMGELDHNPWMARRPLNISHRGGALEFPENTLFAYQRSLEVGSQMIEMDIYESADGELIVIHDDSVDRTTEGGGRISDLSTAELQALDAAYWFVPGRGMVRDAEEHEYVFRGVATGQRAAPSGFAAEDFRIPTLREALERFPNALINIELKPDPEGTGSYEGKLADLLAEYQRGEEVIVASFLDPPSTIFKALAPCIASSVPTAQVAAFYLTGLGPLPGLDLLGHQAFQVPPNLGVEVITPNFIADAHANDMAVHAWTINSCDEMQRLLELGVDGIMTDAPSTLDHLLRTGACPD